MREAENDTLQFLRQNIGEEKWRLVDIGKTLVSCAAVKTELSQMGEVQELGVGKTKSLIVPKTMYLGSSQTDRLALLTYFEGMGYRDDVVGRLLGVRSATHLEVDIERLLGRMHGDCSVLLESQALAKFDSIIFHPKLDKDLRRQNAIVAYCLGGGSYFCVSGADFMANYADNLVRDRIRVSTEAFK